MEGGDEPGFLFQQGVRRPGHQRGLRSYPSAAAGAGPPCPFRSPSAVSRGPIRVSHSGLCRKGTGRNPVGKGGRRAAQTRIAREEPLPRRRLDRYRTASNDRKRGGQRSPMRRDDLEPLNAATRCFHPPLRPLVPETAGRKRQCIDAPVKTRNANEPGFASHACSPMTRPGPDWAIPATGPLSSSFQHP